MSIIPIIDPEFRGLIPPLEAEERAQLEQNILTARKCHDAIITWEHIIIDGHNRYEICVNHGIEFEIQEMDFPSREAVKVWILENQLARRNLTDAMRIEVALLKADLIRKKAQIKQSKAGGDKKSSKTEGSLCPKSSKPNPVRYWEDVADDAGVGKGTFHRYTEIKQHGRPELLTDTQSGELKIGTAHRLLPKEIMKQLRQADKDFSFLQRVIEANSSSDLPQETQDKLSQLPTLLQELINKLEGGSTHDDA